LAGLLTSTAFVQRGRRLTQLGLRVILATGAWLVLGVVTGLVADRLGWSVNDHGMVALIWLALALAGVGAYLILGWRGSRLVAKHLPAVVQSPPPDVPTGARIGVARPGRYVGISVAALVGGLVVLPVFAGPGWSWVLLEAIGLIVLGLFIWVGPPAFGVVSAHVDGAGIRVPAIGLVVPWTSISQVRVKGATHVEIVVAGPVTSTDDKPGRWATRASRLYRQNGVISLLDARPEHAAWIAARYINRT
jgi:hypothetical protein